MFNYIDNQLFIMKKVLVLLYCFSFSFVMFSCGIKYTNTKEEVRFVDVKLTKETKKLHNRLKKISQKGIAFGHQDDTSYGVGWLHDQKSFPSKSDIKEITQDYPAVSGFDLGRIELGNENNIDGVPFSLMKKLMVETNENGGIVTISWHPNNPVTTKDSWDNSGKPISAIFSDAKTKAVFDSYLKHVAEFILSVKDKNGNPVPMIFRPWHEMNGAWFWWGADSRSVQEYIELWKYTVKTLRDTYNIHQLLYCYSPNKLKNDSEYMAVYPGDEWVDMFGIDIYDFKNKENYQKSVKNDLALMKNIAEQKGKLYAFTETGAEGIYSDNWWTQTLLPVIKNTGISYVLVWRNANTKHFYAPYKGQASENDFLQLKKNPEVLFLNEVKKIK